MFHACSAMPDFCCTRSNLKRVRFVQSDGNLILSNLNFRKVWRWRLVVLSPICHAYHFGSVKGNVWGYGHVTRFPEMDTAHRILSARDPAGWRCPPGRPRASWLRQLGVRRLHGGMGHGPLTGPIARQEESGPVAAKGGRGKVASTPDLTWSIDV